MNTTDTLPYGLTAADLHQVTLSYGIYSAKTGGGREEIFFRGDGRVTLVRTQRYDAEPESLEGWLAAEVVWRLFELCEAQRFTGLDEEYRSDPMAGARIMTLGLPDGAHRVVVADLVCLPFERIVGALVLAASLANPAVLQRRFFQYIGEE